MRKQFSNKEILTYATALVKTFLNSEKEIELPIKANFYLQKNMKTFIDAAQIIEESRLKIGKKYGSLNIENDTYSITDSDKYEKAKQDLQNLLSLDQILEIYPIFLSDLKDTKLTTTQMNAIFFMIEEDNEIIDDEEEEVLL